MIQSVITYIVTAILDWVSQLLMFKAKEKLKRDSDQRKNDDIEKKVEDATTEEEAQAALRDAAKRMGTD